MLVKASIDTNDNSVLCQTHLYRSSVGPQNNFSVSRGCLVKRENLDRDLTFFIVQLREFL